jgi:pyruvate ferredoxin oxidoreductase beta subunit
MRLNSDVKTCLGCVEPIITRIIIEASELPVIVSLATGCLEVSSTKYPGTSWNVPVIHSAFGNSAATISGVEAAYNALRKKGEAKENLNFLVIAGDGGTYDIGLQALSGAMERMHKFVYVCLDNAGYMNTGGQRSSSTPYAGITSTTPEGKPTFRKDLIKIAAAHNIPYIAQASIFDIEDLKRKAKKAFSAQGPALINVLAPCPRYWRFEPQNMRKINELSASTCFWPLFEIENGRTKINYLPEQKMPVETFLSMQGRFKGITKSQIQALQEKIDNEWEELKKISSA